MALATETATSHALAVEDLRLAYRVRGVPREVLRGVSFHVRSGEAYGLVGESGCGKSTTAYAALRYLPSNGVIVGGRILVAGADVTRMSDRELRQFRARNASMVYQDPGSALNPSLKVGRQVSEAFGILGQDRGDARQSAAAALRRVRIADPERVMQRYPHQLSGGMQQRVVIAMALACDPKLLVLDEPTTGLDATVEAEVLDLVRTLRSETDAAILLIAHNLGVIRSMCDRVGVMYAGKIVEEGDADRGVRGARSTRTPSACCSASPATVLASRSGRCSRSREHCLRSGPRCRRVCSSIVACSPMTSAAPSPHPRCRWVTDTSAGATTSTASTRSPSRPRSRAPPCLAGKIVIKMQDVSKTFHQHGHTIPALVGIHLGLSGGETLGLVGESGSGKSTLAKVILGIHEPDPGGDIQLDDHMLAAKAADRPQADMRAMQMVFQNPDSALNRSWSVRRILKRSVRKLTGISGEDANRRVETLADALRLSPRHLDMRPRQLSGGLKQRVAIARAFAGDPRIVVCDEPTSALDVSVQAAILNLLSELQSAESTSYLFISHDLGVVRYLADRIVVMYLGRLQEEGTTDQIFNGPHHPYTEALLSAVPSVDGEPSERIRLTGEIPSPANPPSGCVFHTRCHRFIEGTCDVVEPPVVEIEVGHRIRCHLPVEELERKQIVAV